MSRSDGPIAALGYIVVESAQVDRWNTFGAEVLGAQPVPVGEELRLRLDDRPYRLIVMPGEQDRLHSVGWEVRDAQAIA